MFLEFEFRVAGERLMRAGFGQTDQVLPNFSWRPAFQEIATEWARYQEEVFASEGAAGLGKWAPLSPRYAKWKARNYPGMPILTRTGAMRAAAKTVVLITDDRLVLGPGMLVPYAKYHESNRPRTQLPRRPFITPSKREIAKFREIMRKHFIRARRLMKESLERPPRR